MLMLKPLRSLMLYFLETGSWQVDISIPGAADEGRHCFKTGGGCLVKDRACLGESLSGGILPAIPNVAFPNKSTSSSWTNKYLSAKRLILGEGTEGFFQSTLQGKPGCYDRHLHLLNSLSELFSIISSFN